MQRCEYFLEQISKAQRMVQNNQLWPDHILNMYENWSMRSNEHRVMRYKIGDLSASVTTEARGGRGHHVQTISYSLFIKISPSSSSSSQPFVFTESLAPLTCTLSSPPNITVNVAARHHRVADARCSRSLSRNHRSILYLWHRIIGYDTDLVAAEQRGASPSSGDASKHSKQGPVRGSLRELPVLLLNRPPAKRSRGQIHYSLFSKEQNTIKYTSNQPLNNDYIYDDILLKHWRLNKRYASGCGFFVLKPESFSWWRKCVISIQKVLQCTKWLGNHVPVLSIHLIVGVMFYMAFSAAVTKTPSWALSEENLIFLEAWRTIDRAYIDKSFNGQSWFRYRENALRNEPMSTRGETYAAIRKMVATLDDPFTRFLEPQEFKSLRSGTQNTLTGVGLSIGYPKGKDESVSGLVVVSAAPGGPANRAGILSGDLIVAIDDKSTESMTIYDAAERLQGPEGSGVELILRHGSETRRLSLIRERVLLNPVKSRVCKTPGLGDDAPLVGYIKLTSFNQNASGAVREAIETLRGNNVDSFILDLRDNSGGLFPEGVEVAKIWLEKGVIVYICDSRGVRDMYDTDGSNAVASSEPLIVLVNKGTASASEILAGALKDNRRAVLLGEPTYGKGKIQSVFELSDNSGLVVTVARYETPAHTDINKVGIIPDYPLPVSFPKDEDSFCGCLQDPSSACYLNRAELFSR